MRNSLMVLVGLAGVAAFAASAQAGDAAPGAAAVETVGDETAAADHGGGCGYSNTYLQAQIDEAEKAQTRASLEALVDSVLDTRETAAAPKSTPLPQSGG